MPFNGPHLEFAESLDLFNVRLIQSSKLMTAGAATAGAKRASITFSLMSVDSTHPMHVTKDMRALPVSSQEHELGDTSHTHKHVYFYRCSNTHFCLHI